MKPIQGQARFSERTNFSVQEAVFASAEQESSQVALEELSKYISIRTQTILGDQSEQPVFVALRKPSNMRAVGGK